MRLIDADALPRKEVQIKARSVLDGRRCIYPKVDVVTVHSIENAPTIDAVPVVRCRECVHCLWDGKDEKVGRCMEHHAWCVLDGFCHKGEKREEGASDA